MTSAAHNDLALLGGHVVEVSRVAGYTWSLASFARLVIKLGRRAHRHALVR